MAALTGDSIDILVSFRRRVQWQRVLVLLLFAGCSGEPTSSPSAGADLVLRGAAVYTVDETRPWAEAVAVSRGEIVFVGSDQDVQAYIGEGSSVHDLGGAMLLPGFHDSHAHLFTSVVSDRECDLLRLDSLDAVERRLHECRSLEGQGEAKWVFGWGWSEWLWPDSNPHKEQLDAIFPDRPVYLESSFGHSAWVNSRALALAGITADTPDPPQGVIERDPVTGEPTGTLRDAAMGLFGLLMPESSPEHEGARMRKAVALAHRHGITAVIEPGVDADFIEPIVALADAGGLDLRVLASLSPINALPDRFGDEVYELLEERERWRRPNLDVDSVKIYMDGIIESGTGAVLEPYASGDHGRGHRFYPAEEVAAYFTRFDAMGLQVHVHAIGDAGVRMALDGFGAMREANGPSENRHHIVHLQLIDEADVPRFAELDVGATFQSLWAYPDPAAIVLDLPLLGEERTQAMYPIGSIARSGGRIAGGSDFSVSVLDPLPAIEVGITRRDPAGDQGPILNEAERVDLATMLEAYTIHGAWLMGLEDRQGSTEVGKRADLVVLDRNLFEIPAAEISDANVVMTIFDGRVVYSANR